MCGRWSTAGGGGGRRDGTNAWVDCLVLRTRARRIFKSPAPFEPRRISKVKDRFWASANRKCASVMRGACLAPKAVVVWSLMQKQENVDARARAQQLANARPEQRSGTGSWQEDGPSAMGAYGQAGSACSRRVTPPIMQGEAEIGAREHETALRNVSYVLLWEGR